MKKTLIFIFFLTQISFGQNSIETNPSGNFGIIYSKGFGTTTWANAGRTNIFATTGNTSTNNSISAIYGFASNSTFSNQGVIGVANGSSSVGTGVAGYSIGTTSTNSMGVFGYSNVINGRGSGVVGAADLNSIASDEGYGGTFSSSTSEGVNGGANSYGINAISEGSGTVNLRYGARTSVFGAASAGAYGLFSTATNSGNSATYGGYFSADGTGTGNKYGIYATSSGTGTKYAAHLEGKVEVGTLATSHISIESTTIDAWTGNTGQVLQLNNNNGYGVQMSGNLSVDNGDIYINNSTLNYGIVRNKSGLSSDLLPIAYGNVSASGVVQTAASTDNISVTKTATGTYQITVTGELFAPALNAYTVFCNIKDTFGFIAPSGNGTNLIISTANTSGTLTDKPFTFIVYEK
jgi:hypothetical protein